MTSESYETALVELLEEAKSVKILKCKVEKTCGFFFFSEEQAESQYWSMHQGQINPNMDQVKQPNENTVMKATSGTNHVEKTENGRSDIKRSDPEVRLPADIHADEIEQGKVAKIKLTGTEEPHLLMNNESVEEIDICKTNLKNINTVDTDKFKEKGNENMQPNKKERGNKSESSVTNRSVATRVKEEDKKKYSNTIESDQEARMMNIEVQHYEIKGEYLQPNREITDTKSRPLEKLLPTGIDREEEDESNKKIVNSAQRKLEGAEAGPLEEAHSIMSDIIEKVMNRISDIGRKDVTDRTDSEPLDDFRLTNNVLKTMHLPTTWK